VPLEAALTHTELPNKRSAHTAATHGLNFEFLTREGGKAKSKLTAKLSEK
jgi:hypothetical protein